MSSHEAAGLQSPGWRQARLFPERRVHRSSVPGQRSLVPGLPVGRPTGDKIVMNGSLNSASFRQPVAVAFSLG